MTGGTRGDFADAWTSPNDPIFFAHHANVDRSLMAWQRRHNGSAPTYGFPAERLPLLPPGHALDDVIAPSDPFVVGDLFAGQGSALLTNRELLRLTDASTTPYTYDRFDAR